MRPRLRLLLVTALVAAVLPTTVAASSPDAPAEFVLGPEANHLWAYDAETGDAQLVIEAENSARDPVATAPAGSDRRDVNGQVCVSRDGRHFVAGEDTVAGGEGSSHDPRIAGWGYFEIHGSSIGAITAEQVGKLSPEAGSGPGYAGDPDNYGCGFLDADRLLTTALGDTLPGEPANGQLFLWFGPFDAGYHEMTDPDSGVTSTVGEVPHCELDRTLATAGGIAIDDRGDVYVAANRPDDDGNPGAVWRYSGRFPSSPEECTDAYLAANVRKELVVPLVDGAPADPAAPTPSAVAIGPAGTLYVSSVFSGTVSEFDRDGRWIRDVWPTAPVAPRTGPTGDTPFGVTVTGDGSLWIADLGVVGDGPAPREGSVRRVRFDDAGGPQPFGDTIAEGLTFPDGLGVYVAKRGRGPAERGRAPATSEWPCGDWGMYGRTLTRTFSSDCPTRISPATVATLRPKWTFRLPVDHREQATFTASPAIVDGVVYIGSWNGVVYALDLDDGSVIWEFRTEPAPGATFGPVVSSAAVADVAFRREVRRVVYVGAGPRLYALDARTGDELWVDYLGSGVADDPAEVESSPLVWDGTVYVGMDVHNEPADVSGGARGGLFAIDAATGDIRWRYHPEEAAGRPPSGCGGVWGSPTLDTETGIVYFGTANCPAVEDDPALPMEEVTALRADTGEHVWTFRPHAVPGPGEQEADEDFGATPNLYLDADGRRILGAGNKDGTYYALDPATGDVLWQTEVTEPQRGIGGFIGSPAVWRGAIFGGTAIGSPPNYHALDGATGAVRWQGTAGPTYAASAVTNGVVFAGAIDATFRAFDAATGRVLWAVPLPGAISSGAAVVGDTVVVGSGTSTSDLCVKGNPTDPACVLVFDTALGQQGAVHAFELAPQRGP